MPHGPAVALPPLAPTLEKGLQQAMAAVRGAYSLLFLTPREMAAVRDPQGFRPLVQNLTQSDPFLVLADYAAYVACQERVSAAWQDADNWTHKSILNTARGGIIDEPALYDALTSGHIAGVINPPAVNKYYYLTNAKNPSSADDWLAGAERTRTGEDRWPS